MFGELFFASLLPAFLVTVSIYICLNFLSLADMTCDGSFSLGACAFVTLFGYNIPEMFSLTIVFILGCAAGLVTSFMINRIKIDGLLAGIISLTALSSINYLILHSQKTVTFDRSPMLFSSIYYMAIIVAIFLFLIYTVLRSEYGTLLKVYAIQPKVISSMHLKSENIIYCAIILTNGIIAVAGALFIQTQSSVTTLIGNGALVGGIIALIIGENIIRSKTFLRGIFGCLIGTIIYKAILELVTHEQALSLDTELQSLVTAIMIIVLFALKDFRIVTKNMYARIVKKQ